MTALAQWLGVGGNALQLLGAVLTLYGLCSAEEGPLRRLWLLVAALWRSPASAVMAELSALSEDNKARVLQGLAFIVLGYALALLSQVWLIVVPAGPR